jgi:hypothetical protein
MEEQAMDKFTMQELTLRRIGYIGTIILELNSIEFFPFVTGFILAKRHVELNL